MRRKVSEDMLVKWWCGNMDKNVCSCEELMTFKKAIRKFGADRVFDTIVMHEMCTEKVDSTFYLYMIKQDSLENFIEMSLDSLKELKADMAGRKTYVKHYVKIYDSIF